MGYHVGVQVLRNSLSVVATLNRGHHLYGYKSLPLLVSMYLPTPYQQRPFHSGHNFVVNRVALLERKYCICIAISQHVQRCIYGEKVTYFMLDFIQRNLIY